MIRAACGRTLIGALAAQLDVRPQAQKTAMPASIVGEIVAAIMQPVFEVSCYFVGRAFVPVVSLGRIKCDEFTANAPRARLRWGHLYHRRGKQVYLTAEATAAAGVFIVLAIGAGAVVLYAAGRTSAGAGSLPGV